MAIGAMDFESYQRRYSSFTIMNLGGATYTNYLRSKQLAEKALRRSTDKAEREIIAGMVSECNYVLEWLRTGRRPGSMRGVESRNERPWDPAWLESYHSPNGWSVHRESRELTDQERFRIEDAMRDLSAREKQCFIMYHVDGMSITDIARELHLGRSTVQTNLERAKMKIENAKINSLFLLE